MYYSTTKKEIISTFLSLTEIEVANAENISKTILKELEAYNLDINNLVGIGTDNANVMVGRHRSVYVELKKLVPKLVLVKCVCHSVQLAVTRSWKKIMPKSLEFLIHETYNWFSKSYMRQKCYKNVYEVINSGSVSNKKLSFIKILLYFFKILFIGSTKNNKRL